MFFYKEKTSLIKQITLRAAKFPLVYLLIGAALLTISYTDDFFPIFSHWAHLFSFTEKMGNIIIAIAVSAFFYNIAILTCRYFEATLAANHQVAVLVLSSLRQGLRIIFLLIILNITIDLSGPTKFYLVLANDVIKIIIISAVGWIAIQVLYTFEAVIHQSMLTIANQKENTRLKDIYTKMHIVRNIATVIIVLLTIAIILMSFGSVRNIGISLLASAGFLTAIIGLAAQKGLSSILSGLQIVLSQRIKIGDIVMIEGSSGMVEEISFTYVVIKLNDKRRLVVPISFFIDKSFENWSHDPESLRSSLSIFVDYTLPIESLRQALKHIVAESAFWDKQACHLKVANITERSVEISIQVSAADADKLSDLRAEVREKLLTFIRIHYPDHFPKMRYSHSRLENTESAEYGADNPSIAIPREIETN